MDGRRIVVYVEWRFVPEIAGWNRSVKEINIVNLYHISFLIARGVVYTYVTDTIWSGL